MSSVLVALGAFFGAIAVLLGAFGAHGLEGHVAPERLEVWTTAAHYLGWHATTLLVVGLLAERLGTSRLFRPAAWSLAAGILIFSGSLFVLVLTDQRLWGAITPIGGVLLALGWVLLGVAALRAR